MYKNGDGDQFDLFRSDTQKELATSPMIKVPYQTFYLVKQKKRKIIEKEKRVTKKKQSSWVEIDSRCCD